MTRIGSAFLILSISAVFFSGCIKKVERETKFDSSSYFPMNVGDEYYYECLYSGIQDHKERHLKFRRPETYKVLTEKNPPLARQYPAGGVANTPESIDEVYQTVKKIRQGDISRRYHWKW